MPANRLGPRGAALLLLPRACSACLTRSCYPTPQPTTPDGRSYPAEDDEEGSSLHKILVGTLIAVCSLAGVALLILIGVCRQARVVRKRRLIESSHQRSIAGAGIVMGQVCARGRAVLLSRQLRRSRRPRAAQANEVHNEVVAIGLGWNDMTQTSEQTVDTPPPAAQGAAGAAPRGSAAAGDGGEGESTDLFTIERRRRAAEAAAAADPRCDCAYPRIVRF